MYDSWVSRIRLFIKGKKNGRMMLDSIDEGPLVYPMIVGEDGQTRPKKYSKLTEEQQLQDDCDVQATNIILHSLPPDVYSLVNHQEAAKDRVKLLMKGTELSYQERECRFFDKSVKSHTPIRIEAPSELSKSQEKDNVIRKLKERIKSLSGKDSMEKVKKDIDEIETINIELEHNLNAQLQEKVFAVAALKNELRKLKGKNVVDIVVSTSTATTIAPGMFKIPTATTIAPGMLKLDIEPISH
ncbi:hypothetical protein Tco_0251255 [Tanacetum coccineum]